MYFLRAACLLGVRQYMPVLHMLVPGFNSITWSHAWWSGRWWDACSLKTLEYLWYWAGICVMDVALGLFSIAILVLVVDFDLMASSSYLVKLWLYRNDSRASWLKVVSWYWGSSSSGWSAVTIRTYTANFIYFTCTDTGVIATHALSFYRPLAPLFSLTHAQLAVVTQSCALLYIAAHCDLLSQWRYCACDAYCSRYPIVLLQYLSQACWVPCSPRLDFFHRTVISTLVAANRLRSQLPLCLISLKVIHCNVPTWHALVNYLSSETI